MEPWKSLTPKLALRLAAPHTWPASVYPVLFGELYCLLEGYSLSVVVAVALLCACILMQAAVNTFNDFFDYIKGADTREDCLEDSDAVLVYEHINPRHALLLGTAYLIGAVLLALPIVLAAGPVPFIIGAVGVVVVLLYSGGPLPLSYLPVGEVVSGFVMGGLIPLGVLAAVTGRVHWNVLAAALPLILGIGLIMMTNNTCDIEKDRAVNRHTVSVLLGRRRAVCFYRGMVVFWIALLCLMPLFFMGPLGLISPLLLGVFARKTFSFLVRTSLLQAGRIEQMKKILRANLLGNGAYLAALGIVLCMGGRLYG